MLADFDYYTRVFGGRAIETGEAFDAQAARAEAFIAKLTDGRAGVDMDGARKAVCAVCEVLHAFGRGGGLAGENCDGLSVSYRADRKTQEIEMLRAAALFLPDALLYRGFDL